MKNIEDQSLLLEVLKYVIDIFCFLTDKNKSYFKSLLPLALDGTPPGKTKATQALAKIAITTNPESAFPGQRVC